MKSIISLLLLITISYSCNSSTKEEIPVEPVEIPITDYSLVGTSCQWVNLKSNEIIIVNSKSELEKYINCSVEMLPEIDFSEHTLLLASGSATSNIVDIQPKFIKRKDYELDVNVYIGVFGVVQGWNVAILSSKKIKSSVKLNQKQIEFLGRY